MSDAEFLVSLDGNRDRLITKPELVAAVRADLTVRLQERNNDGQVSPAELTTNVEQRLQRRGAAIAIVLGLGDLDADGAGMVDMTELAGPDKIGAELSEVLGLGEGRSLALTELYDRLRQVTADEESRLLSGLQAR